MRYPSIRSAFLAAWSAATVFAMTASPSAAAIDSPGRIFSELEERRREVSALMEEATVWVVGQEGQRLLQGSGFLVESGWVMTNAHVVDQLGKNSALYVLNDKLPATRASIAAMADDEGQDFALLRFTPPRGIPLRHLTFNLDVNRMDRVSAWGYPAMVTQFDSRTNRLDSEGVSSRLRAPSVVYTEGVVNSLVRDGGRETIIHSAAIAAGNSGGPLINSRGEVVGINTWGYTEEGEGAFLNAALPAESVVAFMASHKVAARLAAGQEGKPLSAPSGTSDRRPERLRGQPIRDDRARRVGPIQLTVPRDWSVVDESEDALVLGADDGTASLAVVVDELDGAPLGRIARNLSREQGGTTPTTDDGGESYTFVFSDDDVDVIAVVIGLDDEHYAVIIVAGDYEHQGIDEILDSFE